MKFFIYLFGGVLLISLASIGWTVTSANYSSRFTEYEAGFEEIADDNQNQGTDFNPYANWQRPAGPLKVALQVGHWKNNEVPEEQEGLKANACGARAAGKCEWEVMINIALLAADILREKEVEVEILPTTVPPAYYADAFVAIHADGNPNQYVSGFKIAHPRRDYSGKSAELEAIMYERYEAATGFERDSNVTSRMRGYYAFNWRRYEHAIHPMTPAIILETGFLTSTHDQRILIHNPKIASQAIADSILEFLAVE